ncbi:hypothetical protein R3P38DRAFT_3218114 [Favolaschia claudopus]|uniref:Uncharacterized protein n=1 Tax=Favolaschia claudopus TaxID=2862362 RepID=A0AAV9ZBT8_9AGAR
MEPTTLIAATYVWKDHEWVRHAKREAFILRIGQDATYRLHAHPKLELQHVWPSSTSSRTLAIETKSNGIIGFRFKTESGMAGGISFPPPILSPDHADRALFIAALAIEFEEDVWKDVIYKEGWVGKPTSSSCGENCSPDLGVAEKKTGSIKFS